MCYNIPIQGILGGVINGKEIIASNTHDTNNVIDLMEALKKSIEQNESKSAPKKRTTKKKKDVS